MIQLTDEETKFYEEQKVCYICEKEFCTDKNDENEFKLKHKVRDHCHYTGKFRGATHNICNLRYKIPKEIPIVFHNGSVYDYHFINEQLAIEFKDKFDCLGESTEKYITFSAPIKKNMIMVKQSHTNYNLLIVLDLCQPHCQVLLITYPGFTKKNINHAKKEKKLCQNVNLLVLKITDYTTNVKNVMMNHINQ